MGISKQGVISFNGSPNPNIVSGTNRADFITSRQVEPQDGILYAGSGGNGVFSITKEDVPVGDYSYNITNNTTGNRDYQQHNLPYIKNKIYTASWYAKGSGTCLSRVWDLTTNTQVLQKTVTLTNSWTFYTHTYTATQAMEDDRCSFQVGVTGNASIQICGLKVEQNDYPTAWVLNQYDVGYENNNIGSFIENNNICKIQKQGYIQSPNFIEI